MLGFLGGFWSFGVIITRVFFCVLESVLGFGFIYMSLVLRVLGSVFFCLLFVLDLGFLVGFGMFGGVWGSLSCHWLHPTWGDLDKALCISVILFFVFVFVFWRVSGKGTEARARWVHVSLLFLFFVSFQSAGTLRIFPTISTCYQFQLFAARVSMLRLF